MTINPIRPVNSLEELQLQGFSTKKINVEETPQRTFVDALRNFVAPTNATAAQTKVDALELSAGNYSNNLHNIEINAADADLALRTMISVRNKVLDAYSEIMRITL